MFMPMANTAETLALNECGLQQYVKVDGVPTKKNVLWRKFVDINKIEGELKEINWLYVDVQRNATSTMLEKVTDNTRPAYKLTRYARSNTSQGRRISVKSSQEHLDVPNLFPTGRFGEFYTRDKHLSFSEYVKSRLNNKDSRYRKSSE